MAAAAARGDAGPAPAAADALRQQERARRRSILMADPNPALQQLDPSTAFLYAPHTVSVLLAGIALLSYYGQVFSQPPSRGAAAAAAGAKGEWSRGGAAAGVWAALTVFLGYAIVQGPRTSMARPHPAVWRGVHGLLVAYVLLLVFLLFQNVNDARRFLRHLSPNLGVPVEYRSYAADCRLWVPGAGPNWEVLRGTLLDEFVVAHTLGWWAKALVLRNRLMLWTASIGFELLEQSFRHLLPNFNECWWDSAILDVALCNFLGITVGMATVRWFDARYTSYNWQGLSELEGLGAKARRSVAQLLPYSWTRLEWMVFSSPKRFLQALVPVAVMLTFELNVFFLKYALWVPPTNPLNTYRLILWFLCALPGAREYWEFIEGRSGTAAVGYGPAGRFSKLGTFAWLAIAMTALETLLSIKFGAGLYTAPFPKAVKIAWAAAAAAAFGGLAGWQTSIVRRRRRQMEEEGADVDEWGEGEGKGDAEGEEGNAEGEARRRRQPRGRRRRGAPRLGGSEEEEEEEEEGRGEEEESQQVPRRRLRQRRGAA